MGEKEKNSMRNEVVTKNTVILYTYNKTRNGYNMNIFLCSSLGIQSFF